VSSFDVGGTLPTLPLPTGQTVANIHFNMDVGTFNPNQVTLTQTIDRNGNPVNVPITITSLVEDDPQNWHITFGALANYGTYTLQVDHSVTDTAGHAMNQNGNSNFGENGFAPAGDGFSGTFQVNGLKVLSSNVSAVIPNGPVPLTQPLLTSQGEVLTSIDVTFNMSVAPGSFQNTDAVLLLPDGVTTINPTSHTDLTLGGTDLHNVWRLTFAGQTAPGVYTLTLGPAITDTAGHIMDQNNNQVPNEAGAAPAGDA
jgi:hypothetical protein